MNDLILNTGAVQSPFDERDFSLEIIAGSSIPEVLPQSAEVDISKLSVWMQNKLGACVGHAWAKSQQKCELVEIGNIIPLSARFLYAVSKCLDGSGGEGTYPRITAKVLQKYGCATEKTIPNDTLLDHETYVYNRKIENIPQEAFLEATPYKIDAYGWADLTEDGIKKAIYYASSKNQGVVMLMRVGNTFWIAPDGTVTWDKTKILPIRVPKEFTSGHEVYPYKYDYENGRLRVYFLNSWSKDWGDNGTGWLYYDEWKNYIVEIMTSIDKADVPVNVFSKDLHFGMTDFDVLKLQQFLNSKGFTVAQSGDGSKGKETNFYGLLTVEAVKKLQQAYNILPVVGYFGPKTRQLVNKLS